MLLSETDNYLSRSKQSAVVEARPVNERASPYVLTFEPRPRYLYANVKCSDPRVPINLNYFLDIIVKCRELKFTRIMIEKEIPSTLPVAETFAVAAKVANIDIRGLTIAIVDKQAEDLEPNESTKMTAINGDTRLKTFARESAAEQWLFRGL